MIRCDPPQLHHRCNGDVKGPARLLGQLLGPPKQVKGALGNRYRLLAGFGIDLCNLRLGQMQGKFRLDLPDPGFHSGVDRIGCLPIPLLLDDRVHGIGDPRPESAVILRLVRMPWGTSCQIQQDAQYNGCTADPDNSSVQNTVPFPWGIPDRYSCTHYFSKANNL